MPRPAADWASAIIKGVKYYSDVDIVANCFGKILRNELNEDFRRDLLRRYRNTTTSRPIDQVGWAMAEAFNPRDWSYAEGIAYLETVQLADLEAWRADLFDTVHIEYAQPECFFDGGQGGKNISLFVYLYKIIRLVVPLALLLYLVSYRQTLGMLRVPADFVYRY